MTKSGHGFNQNILALPIKFAGENTNARRIAARLGQRTHKARADRIIDQNDERNRPRRLLRSARRRFPAAQDGINLGLDLVLCKLSKPLDGLSVTSPIHSKVLTLDELKRPQLGDECELVWRIGGRLMEAAM